MAFHKEELKTMLQSLYGDGSKHANYQNIPVFVQKELGYKEIINEKWRGDTARYSYILKHFFVEKGGVVGDLGANTGFFTLSLAYDHPEVNFIAYEANPKHCQFINEIKNYFNLDNILVKNIAINSNNLDFLRNHNILFHLNVLHHAGHDFDNQVIKEIDQFTNYAIKHLMVLKNCGNKRLIFQMGSNWGGNKSLPLINFRDDTGKLILIINICKKAGWKIKNISYPTTSKEGIIYYKELSERVVENTNQSTSLDELISELNSEINSFNLDQFIGEFYRRPLLTLENL